jgi:hypothetical protein
VSLTNVPVPLQFSFKAQEHGPRLGGAKEAQLHEIARGRRLGVNARSRGAAATLVFGCWSRTALVPSSSSVTGGQLGARPHRCKLQSG